ncbi:hypothetical protein [uncultured Kordia sp.]|uniref:hypothetical protein n=1 Tax=uncultured Kordia sp. TaxID=507699 RepID=UPI00262AFE4A|nr:hypothetical protein [uncultured Kordia sp.]
MKENYHFNPFAGVLDHEVNHTIVPRFPISEIVAAIENNQSIAIELIGKQGRGKTTHLIWLQQQLPEYPIFHLGKNTEITEILQHASEVVFVDSIHHLNFKERLQLFKAKRVVIYTTHYTRKLSCVLTQKKLKVIRFKGIDIHTLKKIINNRLSLAQKDNQKQEIQVSESELQELIKKYGDNYRGIINKLYENYQ